MNKIEYVKIYTGHKVDNTKVVFKLYIYEYYTDLKIKKRAETIERKIIKILSNQKLFNSFECDIIKYDERGKIEE